SKTLLVEPLPDRGNIGIRHAKSGRELVRGKPVMVLRRTDRLLRSDQGLQIRLLGCAATEYDADSVQHGSRGQLARIVFRCGHGRVRARESDAKGIVDLLFSETRFGLLGAQGDSREKTDRHRASNDEDAGAKKLGAHKGLDLQGKSRKSVWLWLAIV